ncbi:acetyltransferase [Halobacterium sp. DL1]|nr:acetyltransferase [Halobacterium sp. DL1]
MKYGSRNALLWRLRPTSTPGPLFLGGDTVSLYPAVEADIPFLVETANDPRVRATQTSPLPKDADTCRNRLGGTLGRYGETLALLVCVDGEWVDYVRYGLLAEAY